MGKFKKILSFEPKDIHTMSMQQKRECMNEVNRRKDKAIKFSALFSILLFFFVAAKAAYNFLYLMRDEVVLQSPSPLALVIAIVMIIVSLFACMLIRSMISIAMVLYAASGVYFFCLGGINYVLVLFAFAGVVVYFWLMGVYEANNALKDERGYPDFFELSADMVVKKSNTENETEKSENDENTSETT